MSSAITFNEVPRANISRSSFRRNFEQVTTLDSGYLVPFFVDEVLPGDTYNLDIGLFGRLTTPVVPVLDDIYVDTFFFFVPNRLVWDNWERFQGAQDNPGDSIDYLVPQLVPPTNGYPTQSVADYFGIPTNVVDSPTVNALPFRGLNLIYNEWFRDENLQDSLEVPKGDGPDQWFLDDGVTFRYPLYRRGKRHDYFTSALPWPQKFGGVDLSLGVTAPVVTGAIHPVTTDPVIISNYNVTPDNPTPYKPNGSDVIFGVKNSTSSLSGQLVGAGGAALNDSVYNSLVPSNLWADLTDVTSVTVQQLREAFLMQMFLERQARTGTRYTEILRGLWNVISPDYRIQRPEFLGGSSGSMSITTVPQTSATNAITPQANLAAFGVYSDGKHGFTKSFVEHGYIIGFMNVRTTLKYQQGLDRMWSRKTRYDFAMPQFAHLGEQPILNKEIFMTSEEFLGDTGEKVNDEVFGYQERFAEYRYKNSIVTGKMRSSDPQSLDVWHLAQNFSTMPKLNSEFIEDRPPIERILAVQNEPQFKFEIKGYMNTVRALPVHSIPGFMPYL